MTFMADFTVRIELHDAQWNDYERLHAAMERQGFTRLITSDEGRRYQMPWAEYNGVGSFTSMQVLNIAQAAASTTGKRHAVLVTEATSRAWVGLQKAG
jgi:hypothetical protein